MNYTRRSLLARFYLNYIIHLYVWREEKKRESKGEKNKVKNKKKRTN